jgi:gas vesicle protein
VKVAQKQRSRQNGEIMAKNWAGITSAFAIGVGVGAALGLLLAPNSGEETRAYIRNTARDTVDEAASRGKKVARRGQKAVGDARELLNEAVNAGQGAFREARNS